MLRAVGTEATRPRAGARWFRLTWVLLTLGAIGCGTRDARDPRGADSTAASSPRSQEAMPARADEQRLRDAIARHRLSSLPNECLTLERSEKSVAYQTFDVRERHGGTCGGDPGTAPRLFSMRVDNATGAISTDAKTLPGEFEPLRP